MKLAILSVQLLLCCGTVYTIWQLIHYMKTIPQDEPMEPHMAYIQPRLNAILVNIGIFTALYIPRIISLITELVKTITEHTT